MSWPGNIGPHREGLPGGSPVAGVVPFLRLPDGASAFAKRAARFRQLAVSQSSLAGYLNLMADLAEVQAELAWSALPTPLSDSQGDKPPLDISTRHRVPDWHDSLRTITGRIDPGSGPPAGLLARIRQAADGELESWAECLLAGDLNNIDPGLAPFLAAALQVHWTVAAARLDAGRIGQAEHARVCPICGFLPVASLLQTGGSVHGLRYLVCGLCASAWNRPRIHCIHCGSGKDVAYFGIEGAGEAIKAEACAGCNVYVKVIDREKEPRAEPFADDLASLSLDILMAEEGYRRLGFNPLLIPGS